MRYNPPVPKALSSLDFLSQYGAAIILGVVLLLLLVFLLASFLLVRKRENRYKELLLDESSTVRVVRLDLDRSEVTYFNLKDMDYVKTQDLNSFLSGFPVGEGHKIANWAEDLLFGRPVDDFLECQVHISSKNRSCPSFLKVIYIEKSKKLIYLESHMVRYEKPKRKVPIKRISTIDDFNDRLKSNHPGLGATFCFVYSLGEGRKSSKGYENIPEKVEALIRPFVASSQLILKPDRNEFAICSFDMSEPSTAIEFALEITTFVNREMLYRRKGGLPPINLKAGIVMNKDIVGNGELLVAQARSAAHEAQRAKGVSVHIYKEGDVLAEDTSESSYRSEVERIIIDKKIVYSYRAVVSIRQKRVIGYLGKAEPLKDTSFDSMAELENYAFRAKDTKKLFNALIRNLLPRFVSERPLKSQCLFLPVRYQGLETVLPALIRNQSSKAANLYLWMKDADVATFLSPKETPRFKETLESFKSYGYKICFEFTRKEPMLDNELLSMADAFLIDLSREGPSISTSTRIRSELHALIERLNRYKKPIIGSGLENWSSIEMVASLGVDYLSSDAILPYEAMFRPLENKTMERLRQLKERIE